MLVSSADSNPSYLAYELSEKEANYWRGLLSNTATTFWTLSELVTIPSFVFLAGQWEIASAALFILFPTALFFLVSLISAHIVIRSFYLHQIPKSVRLNTKSGEIKVQDPGGSEAILFGDYAWANGSTVHDTVGDMLRSRRAILIELKDIESQLPRRVFAIPSELAEWETVVRRLKVPQFTPDSLFFRVRKPPLAIRALSRGVSLGLIIASIAMLISQAFFGNRLWEFSIYMLCIVVFSVAGSLFSTKIDDEGMTPELKQRIFFNIPTLCFAIGLISVQLHDLELLDSLMAIMAHTCLGLLSAFLLVWSGTSSET